MKKNRSISNLFLFVLFMIGFSACNQQQQKGNLNLDYEKYTLDNGLQVILHSDQSDPLVAVAIQYHVGSSREIPGKTGFAHLFEHMLFQASENVPQDQFFKKIQDAGGTLNGGTGPDVTTYYEVVPKNALEKVLWMESDRMGFFINTVTQSAFNNQQNVVINEKRQMVDNQPYGHTRYVINKSIYPDGHPYNWQVIGEMEDLKNATVQDVKDFYNKFYGTNNATLVIAGDFDKDEVKAWVDNYFGEIKVRDNVESREPATVSLDSTIRLYHEDNFARVPEMNMVWPTVEAYNKDAYALDFLAKILADGKKAPLYKVLVKEKDLTSGTTAYNYSKELSGEFYIRIRANNNHNLDEIEKAVFEAFKKFETDGISATDVERVKARAETNFFNSMSSVLSKSFQLASYNTFKGDPGFIEKDLENLRAVTVDDIMRVYNTYIKDKPYVITSFVPKGETGLMAENSKVAGIVEESNSDVFLTGQEETAEENDFPKTPSNIDRSVEPPLAADPVVNLPDIWDAQLNDGLKVYGIEQSELPMVRFEITFNGGFLLDDTGKIGVANLITDMMLEGTQNKSPEELEEEIELLGAEIYAYTSNEEIVLTVNTLSRNFEKTLNLVEEIITEQRWDEEQFELAKTRTINSIRQRSANPNYLANLTFNRLAYGKDHIFSNNTLGTEESVKSITIDDLKNFYDRNMVPNIATFHVVGDVSKDEVLQSLASLEEKWQPKDVEFPSYTTPPQPEHSKIYFVDVPGAKQSVIEIGYLSMSRNDPDFYAATVMNYKLGGSFNGILNLILREEKGYTYGARSYFNELKENGTFVATASVNSGATLESVEIFRDEMKKYREGINMEDFNFTRNALIKSNARRFETMYSLTSLLRTISKYDLPKDYIRQEEDIIRNMTPEEHKALAQKYIDPDRMIYVVVGDAATQLKPLEKLGYGNPVLVKD